VQSYFRQILYALGLMHAVGLTHTDLKPENILLAGEDNEDLIKVIDMGGATFDEEYHSTVINTRQYRAPEVIMKTSTWDQSSDLWGVGCIIVELYSGISPLLN
jgi:serine/threonine protein kinase